MRIITILRSPVLCVRLAYSVFKLAAFITPKPTLLRRFFIGIATAWDIAGKS